MAGGWRGARDVTCDMIADVCIVSPSVKTRQQQGGGQKRREPVVVREGTYLGALQGLAGQKTTNSCFGLFVSPGQAGLARQ
jgi:hypothetical protein